MTLPPTQRARRAHAVLAAALALGALMAATPALAQSAGAPGRMIELNAGIHLIHAELADDYGSRMRGLMFRQHLEPNHGMFFVFDETDSHCMWMRNTPLALSVAFIDDDGRIVNIEEMLAQTDTSHCAARPVRYALEMSAHWFSAHGLRTGSILQGTPKASGPGR